MFIFTCSLLFRKVKFKGYMINFILVNKSCMNVILIRYRIETFLIEDNHLIFIDLIEKSYAGLTFKKHLLKESMNYWNNALYILSYQHLLLELCIPLLLFQWFSEPFQLPSWPGFLLKPKKHLKFISFHLNYMMVINNFFTLLSPSISFFDFSFPSAPTNRGACLFATWPSYPFLLLK